MKAILITLVALAGLGGLIATRLISTKRIIDAKKQIRTGRTTISVTTKPVVQQAVAEASTLLGTLAPNRETTVLAETQGKITRLSWEKGQYKAAGSLIAQVENEVKRITMETSLAILEKAKRDVTRFETLLAGKAATDVQLQQARLDVQNAENRYSLDRKAYDDTFIKAPFSGIVTDKKVQLGSLLVMGATIGTLTDVSRLKAQLMVPETQVYTLRPRDLLRLTTSVRPGQQFPATITYIAPVGDEAHNYAVEAVLSNANGQLKAGTYVTANLTARDAHTSLFIPREALLGSIKAAKVYRLDGDRARLTAVQLGTGTQSQVEVRTGLKAGQQVITSGLIDLNDGDAVSVVKGRIN